MTFIYRYNTFFRHICQKDVTMETFNLDVAHSDVQVRMRYSKTRQNVMQEKVLKKLY